MKSIKLFLFVFILTAAFSITAYADGGWRRDNRGWWYDRGDGGWPNGVWQWIDGNSDGYAECYYFDDSGYCKLDTVYDGYQLNSSGMWTVNDQVQTRYIGDVIDHFKNPGRTVLEGTLKVMSYDEVISTLGGGFDPTPDYEPAHRQKYTIFYLDRVHIINIMSGDGDNCFFEDIDKLYLPGLHEGAKYNNQRVKISFNFRRAVTPTDMEVPVGIARALDAYVIE